MIVLAALVLLPALVPRSSFVISGIVVEAIGLGLIARGQVNEQRRAQALAASIDGTRSAASYSGFGGYR
jgi:hypothetical protein